ncbi:MAG TPA: protein kinase, partial [Propionicimonas sp.]
MHPDALLADRYLLRRRLASGGMGEVWLAADSVLGRDVAVKVLSVGSDADQAAVQRFALEARTLAALQHPNIVTIFDSGTPTGTAFIVMELLPGPTLAQLIADRGRLPEAEAVLLAAQVASGLDAAHRAGVIHRDIKPANLMFSSSGMLKVLDFGIARLSQTTTIGLTATNAVIGSASYLSPEQAVGATVDERSDLYSLGCVLVTMVTGRPPFTADHPMAILHQQVNDEPPRLRELLPEASPALEALVQRLLNKRPDARPATAAEVEAQLTAIAAAGPATSLGATTVLLETAAPPVAPPVPPAPTRLFP